MLSKESILELEEMGTNSVRLSENLIIDGVLWTVVDIKHNYDNNSVIIGVNKVGNYRYEIG